LKGKTTMDSKLLEGKRIDFDVSKNFVYKKKLGSGGTGDTFLLWDSTTNTDFAFKKYVPKQVECSKEFYERFVGEIKILFKISHPNIVRIYNYYLYPIQNTGYLQMEYIDGKMITEFEPSNEKGWNELFIEAINAFKYLEDNRIFHRDIKPSNFLITNENTLKIIDFGFGKLLTDNNNDENSIVVESPSNNYPEEILKSYGYDERTEIYYLGNMFTELVSKCNNFSYNSILHKMCSFSTSERYQSFQEIIDDLSKSLFTQISFKENEKYIYRKFADSMFNDINVFMGEPITESDSNIIISKLTIVLKDNSMEDTIKGNNRLIKCFLKGDGNEFEYLPENNIFLEDVREFIILLKDVKPEKRDIIIGNIINRIHKVPVKDDIVTDLPF